MLEPIIDSQYLEMKSVHDSLDDVPDGAYLGIMQEHGWDTDDLVWFAEMQELDPDYSKNK